MHTHPFRPHRSILPSVALVLSAIVSGCSSPERPAPASPPRAAASTPKTDTGEDPSAGPPSTPRPTPSTPPSAKGAGRSGATRDGRAVPAAPPAGKGSARPSVPAPPQTLTTDKTGVAACDEFVELVRCVAPRLPAADGQALVRGINQMVAALRKLPVSSPQILAAVHDSCSKAAAAAKAGWKVLPAMAGCIK